MSGTVWGWGAVGRFGLAALIGLGSLGCLEIGEGR